MAAYHLASTRPRFTEDTYHRGPDGEWRQGPYQATGQWEVICTDCGDDRGPYEQQTPEVQRVRGPYPSQGAPRVAAVNHHR